MQKYDSNYILHCLSRSVSSVDKPAESVYATTVLRPSHQPVDRSLLKMWIWMQTTLSLVILGLTCALIAMNLSDSIDIRQQVGELRQKLTAIERQTETNETIALLASYVDASKRACVHALLFRRSYIACQTAKLCIAQTVSVNV